MSTVQVEVYPEVALEVSKIVNKLMNLTQAYRQVQMRFLCDEISLPLFARLFEIIRQLETKKIEEITRFQVCRGQKITWFDVKPLPDLDNKKPVELLAIILEMEKEIHRMTLQTIKLATEKSDLALEAFFSDQVVLRQVKVIRKRANQLRDLRRSNDEVMPFLTSKLNIRWEIEKLEKRLRLEVTRRQTWNHESRVPRHGHDEELLLIGSTNQF